MPIYLNFLSLIKVTSPIPAHYNKILIWPWDFLPFYSLDILCSCIQGSRTVQLQTYPIKPFSRELAARLGRELRNAHFKSALKNHWQIFPRQSSKFIGLVQNPRPSFGSWAAVFSLRELILRPDEGRLYHHQHHFQVTRSDQRWTKGKKVVNRQSSFQFYTPSRIFIILSFSGLKVSSS